MSSIFPKNIGTQNNQNTLFSFNIPQSNQKTLFGADQSKSINIFGAQNPSSGNTEKNDNQNNKENAGTSNSLFGQKDTNNKGSLFGNIISNNNTSLFGNLNTDNNQSTLFGSSNSDNNKNTLFGNLNIENKKSSLFGSSNSDNNKNTLFGNLNIENKGSTLFVNSNTDNNKINLFGNLKAENNKDTLFGNNSNNGNNKSSLFGNNINNDNNKSTLFGDNSNNDNNKSTLFGNNSNNDNNKTALSGNNSNNDNNKTAFFGNKSNNDNNNKSTEDNKLFSVSNLLMKVNNEALFNDPKNENNKNKNILGFSFGNTNVKNDNVNKNEENNNKISLFNLDNQNNIKIGGKDNNDININIDNKIGIKIGNNNNKTVINFGKKEEELSGSPKKESKNYLFDLSSDLNKRLFKNNNGEEGKTKKEEEKKKKEEEKKKKEEKEIEEKQKKMEVKKEIAIDTQKKNEIKFGTPKKEKPKPENSINFNQPKKVIDSNDNIISNSLSKDNHINNITSSKRLEDNEQIQSALENLYVYDILSSNSINKKVVEKESKQNKIKKNRPINFKLSVKIEGISIMNDKELNMTSLSDENMSNLMKKVRLILKKKFKMVQEIEDFDIYLIKNGKKLPINVRELIGNYIKNQDIIIVSLIHHSSEKNEEKIENEEESESKEQEEDEKKILCPKEKLPILKRKGYNMIPNECVIARMSIDEIKNVKNFAIYNENGKIEFDKNVSIFGVNFDKLFNIEHDLIEYEKGEWCHSQRGTNFNIPATITLYNIHSKINISNNNEKMLFLEFLKNKCQKNLNGKFLSYNFETHELKYKIPYFY